MENLQLTMPRLGVNDEYVTLAQWLAENGSAVTAGQEIAVIETTKETTEIQAPADGFLFHKIQMGTEARVGETIAVISGDASFSFTEAKESAAAVRITEKAQKLIEQYGVDVRQLEHLHIVRERDVLALVQSAQPVVRSKANDVIVVCGGGLAKMCIDLLRLNKAYNLHGLTDANPNIGPDVLGVPYLGTNDCLPSLYREGYRTAVNALGSIAIDNTSDAFFARKKLFESIKAEGFFLPTLIHPSAQIAPSAQLGEGTLVFENAVIGSSAEIGDDCIINTGAIVSHDCKIGNHARISPGAILAGNVTVGENALIGMGVTVYLGVRIGKNVIIANGQNIIGDVPDNTVIK